MHSSSGVLWNCPEEETYTYDGGSYKNYLGNYWDDYTGSDSDGDGIGDSPYSGIGGPDGDIDNYPLVETLENYVVIEEPTIIELSLCMGWNGISCPGDPVVSDWSTVIAGNSDISLVVEYDTTQQAFVMATDIQFGRSYFIGVTGNTQIELGYYPRESLSLPAKAGWNPLGSVYAAFLQAA